MNYNLREISTKEFIPFVEEFHYSSTMPRITKLAIGGFREDSLVAGVSFGYGSRPRHTIQKLFPSLDTKDYLEIGKMCLDDSEPKNSESWFLARAISITRKQFPAVKLIFTWADALWGKPGYIYQASNFLYGGFIWTDVYIDEEGKRLHPLQIQGLRRSQGLPYRKKRTYRPTFKEQQEKGWKHIFGKQFRYVLFLHKEETAKLLEESTVPWTRDYPKDTDCEWKIQTGQGTRTECTAPNFVGTVKLS